MSRDPDGKTHCCEQCRKVTDLFYNDDQDAYLCEACIDNLNEAAWQRQQEADLECPPESPLDKELRLWKEHQKAHRG